MDVPGAPHGQRSRDISCTDCQESVPEVSAGTVLWRASPLVIHSTSMKTPREIRQAAGESQIQAAAQTKTSISTVRIYEADPSHVGKVKRRVLDAHYANLRVLVTGEDHGPQAA